MIILHVGAGKCGSSALQRFLSMNPEITLNDGRKIFYHVIKNKEFFSGVDIKKRALKSVHGYLNSQNFKEISSLDVGSFFGELSDKDIHVFSAESWINEAGHESIKMFLQKIGKQVTVVMYVRPQTPLMNSAFWQWGAWSDIDPNEWIRRRVRNSAKWFSKYEAFTKLDKVEECKVRILSGDIVQDFLSLFGELNFESDNLKSSSNKSLSGELLRVMQRNRHLRPGVHASGIDFILEKYFSGIGGKTPWVIDEEMMKFIVKECLDDNKKLLRVLDDDQLEVMANDVRWWSVFDAPSKVETVSPPPAKDPVHEELLVRAIEVLRDKELKGF